MPHPTCEYEIGLFFLDFLRKDQVKPNDKRASLPTPPTFSEALQTHMEPPHTVAPHSHDGLGVLQHTGLWSKSGHWARSVQRAGPPVGREQGTGCWLRAACTASRERFHPSAGPCPVWPRGTPPWAAELLGERAHAVQVAQPLETPGHTWHRPQNKGTAQSRGPDLRAAWNLSWAGCPGTSPRLHWSEAAGKHPWEPRARR